MRREPKVYLQDISFAAQKIEKYTKGLTHDSFFDNDLVVDAVINKIPSLSKQVEQILFDINK